MIDTLSSGIRRLVNYQTSESASDKPTTLILYALPNGNTLEQTFGKRLAPSDDWHFDIQHIGAQTRFLRSLIRDTNIVLCLLEAPGRSWPAWRRATPSADALIWATVNEQRSISHPSNVTVILACHSGGGSFLFGFINACDTIPDWVNRIIFLDATYGFSDSLRHHEKLKGWLLGNQNRALTVFAYNDSVALLNGRPVVSPTGGTWHRSKLMRESLKIPFSLQKNGALCVFVNRRYGAAFFMIENPKRAILHTEQVERNGLIHGVLWNTPYENFRYQYWDERAYEAFIQ